MNNCFSSQNLFNLISSFLKCQEITILSLVNKSFYSFLNPENNEYINSIYRDTTFKKFYNINNKVNYGSNKELFLDNYKKSGNNWKNILKDLYLNSHIYTDKEINDDVYNSFNVHCYLPYSRVENKITEYEFSTLHQIFCYDINKNNIINSNYYDKYYKNDENIKIEPLKKGKFFEQELINIKTEKEKYNNKNIINLFRDYSFNELDNIYCSNFGKEKNNQKNKKHKYKHSKVIYFLLWLNHTFILFVNLVYKYVLQFSKFENSKKIIIEYSKAHTNLINFGLMVNDKFNNINIIFNYLIKNKTENSPKNNDFKVYYMFLNIMEQNFYQKLKPELDINIDKLLDLSFKHDIEKEQLNNSFDSNNIETNNTEVINEENENDDYLCDDDINEIDENEDNSDENSNNEDLAYQEIIEEYSNLILDFSINKDNCIYINFSKIELNNFYNEYENLFLENFLKNVQNKFTLNKDEDEHSYKNKNILFDEELNSLSTFFSFIKKLTGKGGVGIFHLINRTKLNLLKKFEDFIFNYLNKIINKKFIYDLNNLNKKQNNCVCNKDNIVFNSVSYNNNYNNIVFDLYMKKIDEIKNDLINNNLNCDETKKETIKDAANDFLNSNYQKDKLVALCKEIIFFFYNQIYFYNNEDDKVVDYLYKREETKQFKLFNEN